jgi:AraC-like DNA-binding protein
MISESQRYVSCAEPNTPLGRITMCALSNSTWAVPPEAMRSINHYLISYLIEGSGCFGDQHGFRSHTRPGDLVFQFPGVKHFSMPTGSRRWTRFFIAFEGPVFDFWREHGLLDPRQPVIHLEPISYWWARLQSILETHQPLWQGRSLLEVSRLQEFLADAYCQRENKGELPADRKWLAHACQQIDDSLTRRTDLRSIAKTLGTSYAVFRSRFTRLTGTAPGRFRTARLMAKAGELLVHSELTNKEIADQLDFADEFHFSRRFKSVSGHGPREFRSLFGRSGPPRHDGLAAAR